MRTLSRLSGWHRLWVVAAAIYAILVAFLAYDSFPSQSTIDRQYALETIDSVKNLDPDLANKPIQQVRDAYSDMPDMEIVKRIHEKWLKKNVFQDMEFEEIDKRYKKESENLLKRQFSAICYAFILWLAPVLATYALGWSLGWIYRGFKQPASGKET